MKRLIFLFLILILPIFVFGHHNENDENETNYYNLIDEVGVKNTLGFISERYDKGSLTSDECHFLLHDLGAYVSEKVGVSKALHEATESCRAGFIHGIFLSTNLEKINNTDICVKNSFDNSLMGLQCLHGLGHGLTVLFDYNLSEALEVCNSAEKEADKSACASGVFMEEFSPR